MKSFKNHLISCLSLVGWIKNWSFLQGEALQSYVCCFIKRLIILISPWSQTLTKLFGVPNLDGKDDLTFISWGSPAQGPLSALKLRGWRWRHGSFLRGQIPWVLWPNDIKNHPEGPVECRAASHASRLWTSRPSWGIIPKWQNPDFWIVIVSQQNPKQCKESQWIVMDLKIAQIQRLFLGGSG